MIWFCYFCKKKYFFVLGVAHGDPIFAQVVQHISLETSKKIKVGVVLGQNLGQIRCNVVKKVKALSICFFHILHKEYLLKQKVVVVQTDLSGNVKQI